MDYQQQWRQRPPIQPNLSNTCPSCAFPHFPFCPAGPPFSGAEAAHKRPRFDAGDENQRRLRLIRDHGSAEHYHNHNQNHHHQHRHQSADSNWPYSNSNAVNSDNLGGYSLKFGNFQSSQHFYGVPPPPPPPPPLPPNQPPLPPSPPPPPPLPPANLFPVGSGPLAQSPAQPYIHSKSFVHSSTGFANQSLRGGHGMLLPKQYFGEERSFPLKRLSSDKPTVVDASQLFKKPHRDTRPDNFVIILRGLPGSGKSYLAKMLRDVEVENGGAAPRIHSMDDYFMTEVEKVEEGDTSKFSVSVRGKKPVVKRVMEYCYEPEMEEAYRSSMLKAFKKTLEEGAFTFIIVDDRNLRNADFAQFWATAKSSGYEVYILEASYKDPAGCAARNVHGFSLDDIQKMAEQWEEAPSFYLRLDAKSLCSGDDLNKSRIQEVDMDMEEDDTDEFPSKLNSQNTNNIVATPVENDTPDDSSKDGKIWNAKEENVPEVKELGRSKWSNELDEDEAEQIEPARGKISALSGLIQAYGKEAKSVRWGDKGGNTGFSISAAKKSNTLSLVIGPGAGYNLKSNPLPDENCYTSRKNSTGGTKKQSDFQEQLRAERETFKAAFSKRQVRIGLDLNVE